MNRQEAETAYRSLRSRLDAGAIPLARYNREVSLLRFVDGAGTSWAISPVNGCWLEWNGAEWIAAVPPDTPPPPPLVAPPAPEPPKPRPVQQPPPPPLEPEAGPVPQPAPPSQTSAGTGTTRPASPPAAGTGTPAGSRWTWIGAGSLAAGILAWGIVPLSLYPLICVVLALVLGVAAIREIRGATGKTPLIPAAGIALALLAVILGIL